MKTVLIIGGYGQFGGRLSRRLSEISDLKILVAGRTLNKARAFCAKYSGNLHPVKFDTSVDLARQLTALNPWLVVNAAGPFQTVFGNEYRLPKACIAHAVHYIDLSDSGEFTHGIAKFDSAAKVANIALISGASSVPALSSAVVDSAKQQFSQISSIEGGISPGGKIHIGFSITQALLSYLGKPLRVFRGDVWESETGYSRTHKHTITTGDGAPLTRWFGLCDAPDLLLFPEHYPGVETVRFYGSHELWFVHVGLKLLAGLQKRGLVKNLQNKASFFRWWGTQLGRFATQRGGMFMLIKGKNLAGQTQSLQWNLIADKGDGPFIPVIATEILIKNWLQHPPKPGARSAASTVSLDQFQQAFSTLGIQTSFTAPYLTPPLFEKTLRKHYQSLPAAIQKGHNVTSFKTLSGRVDILRGKNPITHVLANIIGFAKSQKDAPITVTMDVRGDKEVWTRTIQGAKFRSILSPGVNVCEIYEQFGPVKFKIYLRIDGKKLYYDIVHAKIFGLRLPRFLSPQSLTYESTANGKFTFDVQINLPLLGHLIAYKGWLE